MIRHEMLTLKKARHDSHAALLYFCVCSWLGQFSLHLLILVKHSFLRNPLRPRHWTTLPW